MAEAQVVPETAVKAIADAVVAASKPRVKPRTVIGTFKETMQEAAGTVSADADGGDEQPSAEDRARTLGHQSKDEWTAAGKDPAKWRDAKEFLDFGEQQIPVRREHLKKLEDRLVKSESDRAALMRDVDEFKKFKSKVETTSVDSVLATLKARRKEAVERSDGEAFEQADAQIADLEAKRRAAPAERETPRPSPEFEAWKAENKWFQQDQEMTEFADAIAYQLKSKNEPAGRATLDKITERVKRAFPEKFKTRARGNGAETHPDDRQDEELTPSVESGSNGGRSVSARHSYEALPPDAKKACDSFVKRGWMTRAEYLAEYDWS